ncbi:hemophore-related protein [Mycolicibacterium brumae]|uniref:Hemophore-related protein n=1 Tax=Mycolicibacterium brumae TaxID=85968 RepID=A0A2G5PE22_9MYCO|nr:hemophore-related protein [Mycolicibacterium brumae]MCV7192693.1 hemophore-related protein [Mycolicibacterium brumae]PIB76566.1 hemophore-related protein [Mycolicibacterium brumae]RWA23279.1 hypothetical protein MBRU_00235 [Mycolicibacterium brumae DSM 44177]UWW08793.1 hemophore-related protein [Mycolicibacterium brumae]
MKKTILVAAGVASAGLFLGSGIASANPDFDTIANSTCTYSQVQQALNTEYPFEAGFVNGNPELSGWVQQLVNSSPDQRQKMLNANADQVAPYSAMFASVATSCNNYPV